MADLEQERHVELVPGAAEAFFVTNRMVSAVIPDQLPHLNIFVILVADPLDPTRDSLARVANIADLSTVPIGRDPGIAAPDANGIEYLSDSSTNIYDTLETANDAATAFQDRVNQLIMDWVTFRTKFNAPDPTPAHYILPRVDSSQLTTLITAYTIAKQDRYTKQISKLAADDTLARAQADFTYKQNLVSGITAVVADIAIVQSEFATTISQFGLLLAAANTFYGLNSGGPGAGAFAGSITTATAQLPAMAGYTAHVVTAVVDATDYKTARQADATAASTAVTAAQLADTTKSQLLSSALVLEAAALAAVLAVCPDFDSTTIPLVPG